MINRFFCPMFARQCFTYIFVTLETSFLTSCIFPFKITFSNPSWLNTVVGDAISVVCPYVYMVKCAITCPFVMDPRIRNKPIFLEKTFRYFLLSKFRRRKLFLRLMRHVTVLRNVVELLFLWDRESCCWQRGSNKDCFYP